MRSSVGGCVENSFMNAEPLNGLMMNMCAVAGDASIGIRCDQPSSFCSPLISPSGVPQYLAAVASARILARAGDRHLDHHGRDRRENRHEQARQRG